MKSEKPNLNIIELSGTKQGGKHAGSVKTKHP
jgi:hypothetical protein